MNYPPIKLRPERLRVYPPRLDCDEFTDENREALIEFLKRLPRAAEDPNVTDPEPIL